MTELINSFLFCVQTHFFHMGSKFQKNSYQKNNLSIAKWIKENVREIASVPIMSSILGLGSNK